MFVSLFIIISITFFLMKLMPGSPFNDAKLSPEQKQILAEKYGLNDPVGVQYLNYLKKCYKWRLWEFFSISQSASLGFNKP